MYNICSLFYGNKNELLQLTAITKLTLLTTNLSVCQKWIYNINQIYVIHRFYILHDILTMKFLSKTRSVGIKLSKAWCSAKLWIEFNFNLSIIPEKFISCENHSSSSQWSFDVTENNKRKLKSLLFMCSARVKNWFSKKNDKLVNFLIPKMERHRERQKVRPTKSTELCYHVLKILTDFLLHMKLCAIQQLSLLISENVCDDGFAVFPFV